MEIFMGLRDAKTTQADSSIHAVSIDPGDLTPFTWYSPTKGVKLANTTLDELFVYTSMWIIFFL